MPTKIIAEVIASMVTSFGLAIPAAASTSTTSLHLLGLLLCHQTLSTPASNTPSDTGANAKKKILDAVTRMDGLLKGSFNNPNPNLAAWLAFLLDELQQVPSSPEVDEGLARLQHATLPSLPPLPEVWTLWRALATHSLAAELGLQTSPPAAGAAHLDNADEGEETANEMEVTVRFEHIYDDESDFGQQSADSDAPLFSVDVQGDRSVLRSLEATEVRRSARKKRTQSAVLEEEGVDEKTNRKKRDKVVTAEASREAEGGRSAKKTPKKRQ